MGQISQLIRKAFSRIIHLLRIDQVMLSFPLSNQNLESVYFLLTISVPVKMPKRSAVTSNSNDRFTIISLFFQIFDQIRKSMSFIALIKHIIGSWAQPFNWEFLRNFFWRRRLWINLFNKALRFLLILWLRAILPNFYVLSHTTLYHVFVLQLRLRKGLVLRLLVGLILSLLVGLVLRWCLKLKFGLEGILLLRVWRFLSLLRILLIVILLRNRSMAELIWVIFQRKHLHLIIRLFFFYFLFEPNQMVCLLISWVLCLWVIFLPLAIHGRLFLLLFHEAFDNIY